MNDRLHISGSVPADRAEVLSDCLPEMPDFTLDEIDEEIASLIVRNEYGPEDMLSGGDADLERKFRLAMADAISAPTVEDLRRLGEIARDLCRANLRETAEEYLRQREESQ